MHEDPSFNLTNNTIVFIFFLGALLDVESDIRCYVSRAL